MDSIQIIAETLEQGDQDIKVSLPYTLGNLSATVPAGGGLV